jgi:hypothetical protein
MTERKERFESDTQKIVRRHLEDEDHQITEDEIASVRVGMTPPLENTDIEDTKEKAADHKSEPEDETLPGSQKVTPWDTLDPE